jgi:ribose 5-phosphate isomerase A
MTDPRQNGKRAAARAAADEVRTGTAIGLGTGSTVAFALERLAERRRDSGLDFVGVPTSEATAARARELGLPLTTLEEAGRLDLTIDGADEVDPALQLVKGGGGALTREKIVAAASDRFLVIVDATKLVPHLGATFRLPIEVLEFAWPVTARHIEELGLPNVLRANADGAPYRTDNGHFIVDATLGPVEDLTGLEAALDTIPGVGMPYMASAFGIFLMRQAFKGVPIELHEAARIEGCGWFGILWRVYVPLARPT